jgi:hypothetical protein
VTDTLFGKGGIIFFVEIFQAVRLMSKFAKQYLTTQSVLQRKHNTVITKVNWLKLFKEKIPSCT